MRERLFLGFVMGVLAACVDDAPPQQATASGASATLPPIPPPLGATSGEVPDLRGSAVADPTAVPPAPSASASTSASSAVAPKAAPSTSAAAVIVKAAPSASAPEPAPSVEPIATAFPTLPEPVAGSADAVARDIDAIFKDQPRYRARFAQKYTMKVAGKTKEEKGVVIVQRPNKISFRYDAPNQNRIVSDGKEIKIYTSDDKQMLVQPVDKTQYPGAFGFIMGQGLRSSFAFAFNDKATFALGPVLIGTPTTPNPQYEKVLFYVNTADVSAKKAGAVNGVLILDAQGNKNRFEFFEASVPASIDPSEFEFTPPPGTTVVRP